MAGKKVKPWTIKKDKVEKSFPDSKYPFKPPNAKKMKVKKFAKGTKKRP